jgi:hypothetical protein
MTATGAVVALLIIVIYEFGIGINNHKHGRTLYERARRRADEQGKPLIVVGDPHNGISSWIYYQWTDQWSHDCGDHMIDMLPCSDCATHKRTIKQDLIVALGEWPDNSAVVYVGRVLEYVEPLDTALAEINRVAGSPQNMYIAYTPWYSFMSLAYPGDWFDHKPSKNIIYSAPPQSSTVDYKLV